MSDIFLDTLEKLSQGAGAPPLQLVLLAEGQRITGTIVSAEDFATELTLQLKAGFPAQSDRSKTGPMAPPTLLVMYHGKREDVSAEIQRTAKDGDFLHLKDVQIGDATASLGFLRVDRAVISAYSIVPPPPAPASARPRRA